MDGRRGRKCALFCGMNITPDTDLETLNLSWSEKELPQKERTKHVHALHPYMGKFVPQIVETFLRKFEPGFVYDPFCGSGTTLVEAKALGIDCWGTDISAFNTMLTKAKTADYDLGELEREAELLLKYLNDGVYVQITLDTGWPGQWFSPRSLGELNYFKGLIEQTDHENLWSIVLSRAARSARMVPHYDLDFPKQPQVDSYYCYKHKKTCTPVDGANKFIRRYIKDTVKRIKEYSELCQRNESSYTPVEHGDVVMDDIMPYGIDLVITSPPYVGMIDYHEQHRYAYELLGLEDKSDFEIGSARDGTSKNATEGYKKCMDFVWETLRDKLQENAKLVIVVNDKRGLFIPEDVGYKEIAKLERNVNRRTGLRKGTFNESVLVWEVA